MMLNVFLVALTLFIGYCITAGIALAVPMGLHSLSPRVFSRDGVPKPSFLFLNTLIWLVASAAGGALVGYACPWHPFAVVLLFACMLFAVVVSVALRLPGSSTSLNYEVLVATIAALGGVGGGLVLQMLHLHLRVMF